MRRPMRWYWAALLSLGAFYLATWVMILLLIGWGPRLEGLLYDSTEWLFQALASEVGGDVARYVLFAVLGTPTAGAALLTYALLRRNAARGDRHIHCLNCGYILKGLVEPRCPECGEPI